MKKSQLLLIIMLYVLLCLTGCLTHVDTKTEMNTKTEKKVKEDKKAKEGKKSKKSKEGKKSKGSKKDKESKKDKANQKDKEDKKTKKVNRLKKDELSGTDWTSLDDDSYWIFNEDHSFYWYLDREDKEDYYGGTYKLYKGWEALEILDNELASYHVTSSEILELIERADEYSVDDFMVLWTDNTTYMLDGEEQISDTVVNTYYGFLCLNGEAFRIVNMKTGTEYIFIKGIEVY